MAATTAAALTTLRGATTDAATTGPCLEEDDCFPNLYDDYTVEAVAGALAFVVLLAVMVLAVVCDRDAKGVRATALSDMQSTLLQRFGNKGDKNSIELTTFQKETKLQFVLSLLHYRSIMAPRQVLSDTVPWQQAAPGIGGNDRFSGGGGGGDGNLAGAASSALTGMNISKAQLARVNIQLYCNLLCTQVLAAPTAAGVGISTLTVVHCDESPSEEENARVRRQMWCAYFGVAERSRIGLDKYEMQTVIAKTLRVDNDLIAFDVARCSYRGVGDTPEGRAKLDTVLRAWVQLCNAQLDTSETHGGGGGSGGGGGGSGTGEAASSFNTENDGRSGGIGMVYKQSLAAVAAPLLVVAGGDEVLATAFLWTLTRRHRGLYVTIVFSRAPMHRQITVQGWC